MMNTSQHPSAKQIDWQYAILGAAVAISGTAIASTALFNVATRVAVAQGASQQEIYSYLMSPTLTMASAFGLINYAFFGFLGGRVATMRTKRRSLAAGAAAGLLALSMHVAMALSLAPDPRATWQIALGVLAPLLGSAVGAASRSDA